MTRTILIALVLAGCSSPIDGDWQLEHDDLENCTIDLDLTAKMPPTAREADVQGVADLDCEVPVEFDGEWYLYPLVADDAGVSGTTDREEFEISFVFYDEIADTDWELEVLGEIDGDDMEGELLLAGDDFGTFTGER